MSALFATLHHILFLTIMLMLSFEMLMLKQPSPASIRKIMYYDAIYGIAAILIVIIGALRVMYFEKGAAYYMHSTPFIAKMIFFIATGLISVYPTVTFLKWNKSLKQGVVPHIDEKLARRLRLLIHVELTLLLLVIVCAAMMAKGIGYFGN